MMMEVFYRIYPGGGADNRPIFNQDKLALMYACLLSFAESCVAANVRPRMTFIMDGCPESWCGAVLDAISRVWSEHEDAGVSFVSLDGVGNKPSFQHQLELALASEADTIYFAEDDYLYRRMAMWEMYRFAEVNLMRKRFWTPYDHPDRYTRIDDRGGQMGRIKAMTDTMGRGWHWRTAESTCMTFGGPAHEIKAIRGLLHDHACTGRDMWYPIIDAHYELWSPVPSLATHVHSDYLAPCINWHDELQCLSARVFSTRDYREAMVILRPDRWR